MDNTDLRNHFIALYSMALADARIDFRELKELYKIAERKGVDQKQIEEWLLTPCESKSYVPDSSEKKMEFLYDLARVIVADNHVDDSEIEVLKKYCVRFGYEYEIIPETIEFLIQNAKDDIPLDHLFKKLENE